MKIQIFIFSIICISLFSCEKNAESDNNQNDILSRVFLTYPLNNSSIMDTILVRCDSIKDINIIRLDLYVDGDSISSTSNFPFILPFITNNFSNTLVLATEIAKIYCDELSQIIYPEVINSVENYLKIEWIFS